MDTQEKKYQIIYADPPWSYNDKMSGHSFSLDHEYPTEGQSFIENLPVPTIVEKDAVLFLWATSPLLEYAMRTIVAWGFKYKTLAFCWVKQTKNGKQVHNLGRWTMGGVELCLLAVRGKPKRAIRNIKQVVAAERTRHSAKPEEVRNRIVQLMGDIPRIELFARTKTPGWDVWGNEVDSDITLSSSTTERQREAQSNEQQQSDDTDSKGLKR